jgi:hypothetical protein
MSMKDQEGNELLEPSSQNETRANEYIWAVFEVRRGSYVGKRVTDYMTLYSAREEEQKRSAEIGEGAGYSLKVYCLHRSPKRRMPQKPSPRKR